MDILFMDNVFMLLFFVSCLLTSFLAGGLVFEVIVPWFKAKYIRPKRGATYLTKRNKRINREIKELQRKMEHDRRTWENGLRF